MSAYYGVSTVHSMHATVNLKGKVPALMEFTFQWEINKSGRIRVSCKQQIKTKGQKLQQDRSLSRVQKKFENVKEWESGPNSSLSPVSFPFSCKG